MATTWLAADLCWHMLQVGAGFWLTDLPLLKSKAEELAKAQYGSRKDPTDAALIYMALGKKLLLQVCTAATFTFLLLWVSLKSMQSKHKCMPSNNPTPSTINHKPYANFFDACTYEPSSNNTIWLLPRCCPLRLQNAATKSHNARNRHAECLLDATQSEAACLDSCAPDLM